MRGASRSTSRPSAPATALVTTVLGSMATSLVSFAVRTKVSTSPKAAGVGLDSSIRDSPSIAARRS